MDNHELRNTVTFSGENIPNADDEKKQTRELLEKYNISKEYLPKKSDELLDTVLTNWQIYSGSSYSRSNMGRLTIILSILKKQQNSTYFPAIFPVTT